MMEHNSLDSIALQVCARLSIWSENVEIVLCYYIMCVCVCCTGLGTNRTSLSRGPARTRPYQAAVLLGEVRKSLTKRRLRLVRSKPSSVRLGSSDFVANILFPTSSILTDRTLHEFSWGSFNDSLCLFIWLVNFDRVKPPGSINNLMQPVSEPTQPVSIQGQSHPTQLWNPM